MLFAITKMKTEEPCFSSCFYFSLFQVVENDIRVWELTAFISWKVSPKTLPLLGGIVGLKRRVLVTSTNFSCTLFPFKCTIVAQIWTIWSLVFCFDLVSSWWQMNYFHHIVIMVKSCPLCYFHSYLV